MEGFEPIECLSGLIPWTVLFLMCWSRNPLQWSRPPCSLNFILTKTKKVLALKMDDFETYLEKELTCPLKISWFDFDGVFYWSCSSWRKRKKKRKEMHCMQLIFCRQNKSRGKNKKVHKKPAMMVKAYVEHYARMSGCESGPSFHIWFLYVLIGKHSHNSMPLANSHAWILIYHQWSMVVVHCYKVILFLCS